MSEWIIAFRLFDSYILINFIFLSNSRIANDKGDEGKAKQRTNNGRWLPGALQFWFLTGILAIVGSRVTALVVLEFILRAISAQVTAGPVRLPFVFRTQYVLIFRPL